MSAQRRENPQHPVQQKATQTDPDILPQHHVPALPLGGQEILVNLLQKRCLLEQGVILKMKEEAAVIQVDGAYRPYNAVHHTALGVDEAGNILVNFSPGLQ